MPQLPGHGFPLTRPVRRADLRPRRGGFPAELDGVTSSVTAGSAATKAARATSAQHTSAVPTPGMGVTRVGLSLGHQAPVVSAWPTPRAAPLAACAVPPIDPDASPR